MKICHLGLKQKEINGLELSFQRQGKCGILREEAVQGRKSVSGIGFKVGMSSVVRMQSRGAWRGVGVRCGIRTDDGEFEGADRTEM